MWYTGILKRGGAVMDSWANQGMITLLANAEKDPLYQQLLTNYREIDIVYNELRARLSREDAEILETYLAAGEAVYYRLAQIAYHCGKATRLFQGNIANSEGAVAK